MVEDILIKVTQIRMSIKQIDCLWDIKIEAKIYDGKYSSPIN